VIAHRGASRRAPENTLAAFRLAFELGADGIELDVQLTADGEVVVLHDAMLDRTTTGHGPVWERSLADLKRLDAGIRFGEAFSGELIPTLAEVLDGLGPHALVDIEVANYATPFDRLPETVASLVQARCWGRQVLVTSLNPIALRKLRRLLPGVPLGLLLAPNRPLLERIVTPLVSPYDYLLAHEAYALAGKGVATARWDLPIVAWTLNDPSHLETLIRRGVEGVITDVPEVARAIVSQATVAR